MNLIMKNGLEVSGGDRQSERINDPEVAELLEFLEVYNEIQRLLTWLVEASPGAEPSTVSDRRAHLQALLKDIGLDPDNLEESFMQLEEMENELSDRALHPKPRIDVPEAGYFESQISRIMYSHEISDGSINYGLAIATQEDIAGIIRYGHTDWRTVRSRSSDLSDAEWVHGIARIMADPVAYQIKFTGLHIDGMKESEDPIRVTQDWDIQNGRHRSLAALSLGEDYIHESGMRNWVPVEVD